ncbi:bifunctional oligoribonuclease/PAP phosphatase NrnA [Mycoplasma marinum]|uniref:DHH family phosphoesterase n=1 Tax=Mycoplasma marinum TaxID=1937190 RepID=UPI003B2A766D
MKQEIIKKLKEADKIALFHHINPDGDTLSSSYGLAKALRQAFPEKEIAWVINREAIIDRFPWIELDESLIKEEIDETWTTVIGDTSAFNRIDRKEEFAKGKTKICFDHHRNTPDYDYDVTWIESSWIASSLQAVEIAEELEVEYNEDIAFHLAIGILTDSGNFVYSRSNPHPVLSFGKLLHFISNEKMDFLYQQLKRRTQDDIEIVQFILNNMQFKDNLTFLKADKTASEKFGGKNLKIKVNQMANIEGFDRWAIFVEMSDKDPEEGIIAEFRSLGCNTSEVAISHGGGGHVRASGCPPKSWEEVDQIIDELIALPSKFEE